ncbi:MAG: helix-turn-helix domain-containing protein [Woeseiaceae bacterium]|nr:helix-turn-helix domain-containing protein [Woeseiaceae bacterium]
MARGIQTPRTAQTSSSMAYALGLAGRKWSLRIVWELRLGPMSFRALRAACGQVSPSVLADRLQQLGEAGIVENIPRLGYRLTARGERLFQVLAALDKWSQELENNLHQRNR